MVQPSIPMPRRAPAIPPQCPSASSPFLILLDRSRGSCVRVAWPTTSPRNPKSSGGVRSTVRPAWPTSSSWTWKDSSGAGLSLADEYRLIEMEPRISSPLSRPVERGERHSAPSVQKSALRATHRSLVISSPTDLSSAVALRPSLLASACFTRAIRAASPSSARTGIRL